MLNDMKISSRLAVLLSFVLAGLILIGIVGLFVANKISNEMEDVLLLKVTPLIHLNAISKANLSNRIAIANAIVQPEKMAEFSETIAKNKAEIDTHWQAFMTSLTDQEDRDLAKKFSEVREQFVEKAVKPALVAMRTNNADELKKIMIGNVNPLYAPLFDAMDDLIEMEKRDIEKLHKEGSDLYKNTQMISITLILIGVISGSLLGMSIIRGIRRSVGEMRNVMVTMSADGNLNARAKVYGKDEIGQAAIAFNALIEGFANIIRQVNTSSATVSSTATKLASSSALIAQSSLTQSEAAASTAAAVEEITVSINSVAANAEDVRKLSEKSLQQTQQGNQSVTAMIGEIVRVQEAVNQIAGSVKEFVDSTRAIAGMTQQVKEIADQTNLLALNAAIEAARAGEQGRGFAVVADEVRKLAEKSAKSASEIDLVTNSLNQKSTSVEEVVQAGLRSLKTTQDQVGHVSSVLEEAGVSVEQSSRGVHDIAAAVGEQSAASTEIARHVEKIAQMSEENHAAEQSTSQDIERLDNLAKELQSAVSRFRV